MRDDAPDEWGASGTSASGRRGGDLERRLAGPRRVGVEDDHERRLRHADLGLEERLGPRRLEVVADEAAGRSAPGVCSASGTEARISTAQVMATAQRCRADQRPSRSNRLIAARACRGARAHRRERVIIGSIMLAVC